MSRTDLGDDLWSGRVLNRDADHRQLDVILDKHRIRAVYQPVVDMASETVVGYEALARGPAGSPFESPDMLFATARRTGRLMELEWECRAAALRGAIEADLGSRLTLFVNVEPSVVRQGMPVVHEPLFRTAQRKLRVVLELTERDLTRRPAELLRLVAWAREHWWGIALDDVGAEPDSLALLPLLAPDVVKLDLSVVQQATPHSAAIIETVAEYVRLTGATVLAEGIETEEHLARARGTGATLGQGWLFGAPGAIEAESSTTAAAVRLLDPPAAPPSSATPFDLATRHQSPDTVSQDELMEMTAALEVRAMECATGPVVIACFGHHDRLTPGIRARYERLARRATFVGVLGVGVHPEAASPIRPTPLHPDDPLKHEWTVAVAGPSFASVLAAKAVRSDGHLKEEIEVAVSDNRDLALACARLLMLKLQPDHPA